MDAPSPPTRSFIVRPPQRIPTAEEAAVIQVVEEISSPYSPQSTSIVTAPPMTLPVISTAESETYLQTLSPADAEAIRQAQQSMGPGSISLLSTVTPSRPRVTPRPPVSATRSFIRPSLSMTQPPVPFPKGRVLVTPMPPYSKQMPRPPVTPMPPRAVSPPPRAVSPPPARLPVGTPAPISRPVFPSSTKPMPLPSTTPAPGGRTVSFPLPSRGGIVPQPAINIEEAVKTGNRQAIVTAIDRGANVNQNDGRLLDLAFLAADPETYQLLLNLGAIITKRHHDLVRDLTDKYNQIVLMIDQRK